MQTNQQTKCLLPPLQLLLQEHVPSTASNAFVAYAKTLSRSGKKLSGTLTEHISALSTTPL